MRSGWRRIGARVNEIGREHEDDGKTGGGGGDHPSPLAAALRFKKALLGFIQVGGLLQRGRKPLPENQKKGCSKNKDEEKKLVANNRANYCHLLFTGRNPLRL